MCRLYLAASAFVFVLSGCSVVVFEDGPACPVDNSCPVVLPTSTAPEIAPVAVPENTQDLAMPAAEPNAALPPVDGHISYFGYDSAEIDAQAQSALRAVAATLIANKDGQLLIEGHCDERGSRDYNLALGDRRAAAVRDYLVTLGVAPDRIKTVSFGKERPLALGTGAKIWARNRRAVIRQLPQQ